MKNAGTTWPAWPAWLATVLGGGVTPVTAAAGLPTVRPRMQADASPDQPACEPDEQDVNLALMTGPVPF